MKTDPDFHPLAAGWLDGQATDSEQAVLQEILSENPAAMAEFAALCRTEVLLSQASAPPAARREALNALLSGKPWPERAVRMWRRHRSIRWSAAAALLVVGAGLWMAGSGGLDPGSPASAAHTPPPQLPKVPGGMRAQPIEDSADWIGPHIDPELRRLLERMPVADFKAHGSLADVVDSGLPTLENAEGTLIPVRVVDGGDAPVFLEFKALMPAWHLLGLMALQTGTALSMEDGALVFRQSEKPASLEDETTRTAKLANLRALLGLRVWDQNDNMTLDYATGIAQALGSDIRFRNGSETSIGISGSARNVKVLTTALDAALSLPTRATLSVAMFTVPPQVTSGAADGSSVTPPSVGAGNAIDGMDAVTAITGEPLFGGGPGLQLMGIFNPEQYKIILKTVLQYKGGNIKILLDQPVVSNQENVTANRLILTDGRRQESQISTITKTVKHEISLNISALNAVFREASFKEHTKTNFEVLAWLGQTVAIGGAHPQSDGSGVRFLVTATDSGESLEAPSSSESSPEVPAATPVPGKPGFVRSPLADFSAELDVSALKQGSAFTCPLTGQRLRVP